MSETMSRYEKSTQTVKRLCVLSDGTWQTLENTEPTNILKLTMAIEREDDNGVQQVIFYDSGVGTQGAVDKVLGGGLGEGIDINIKELYTFLALNYDDGDEVYLFGFSRGSYTVRSLAGFIYESGLVRRDHIQFVHEAYELYRLNEDVESELAVSFRSAHGERIPIKLLACFDTVGSLGLPFDTPSFLGRFSRERYQFHTTKLNPLVENAIHMLAIDEDRSVFSPTIMEMNEGAAPGQLTQLYFWGGHGGIGGGDVRQIENANCTLRFCVEEMQRRSIPLVINMDVIPPYGDVEKVGEEIRSSRIMSLVERVTGKYVRPIDSVQMLHPLAIRRYQKCPSWRPAALESIHDEIMAISLQDDENGDGDVDE